MFVVHYFLLSYYFLLFCNIFITYLVITCIAHDLGDTVAANYNYKLSPTCVSVMNLMISKYILTWHGTEMIFEGQLTFGTHVSVDAH